MLLSLPPEELRAAAQSLSEEDAQALLFDWRGIWARPGQLIPPGDWSTWLLLAGRGYGKSRAGAEAMCEWAGQLDGGRGALVANTPADARDIMVEGESGILAVSPPRFYPLYEPAKKRLTWPNGFQCAIYSAYENDKLRGPQHHVAWAEELAAWKHMQQAWDNLAFGLRLGKERGWIPRAVVTTTPRPLALLKTLLKAKSTVVTRGSTYENRANLADAFLREVEDRYAGTRLGRQELEGELLEEVEGALWTLEQLDALRVDMPPIRQLKNGEEAFDLERIIVGVDPAGKANKKSNLTGIVADGLGANGHGYLLDDWTCQAKPEVWGRRVVELFHKWKADAVVAEVNNGGDMVEAVIKAVDEDVPVIQVTASRGKHVRAEPVSTRYEQGRWHHCGSELKELEDQLVHFTHNGYQGDDSPDRADAHVWAVTELMEGSSSFIV